MYSNAFFSHHTQLKQASVAQSVQWLGHRLKTKESCFGFRKGKNIFCSPKRHDGLWGPASLLFNGYGIFPQG
jgi:hypothetical protein